MDNAVGEDDAAPTYRVSRGMLMAVNTLNMSVSLLAHYNHPDNGYAPRRGNMQYLDNGNVFLGWSEHGLMSEHAVDGTLLMKARVLGWLGNYRNYKFNFVGRPCTRPDVVAHVYLGGENGTATTKVYVSWNGDTEVRTWNLLKVDTQAQNAYLISSAKRTSFETFLQWSGIPGLAHIPDYSGYAEYIYVEGLDKDGNVVTERPVWYKTTEHPSDPDLYEELGNDFSVPTLGGELQYHMEL